MKKLLASVAVLSLVAACAQEAEEPAAPVEEVAEGPTMETYVGAWDVTFADGTTAVTTNNADGTFTRVLADGTQGGGTWTFAPEQSCWTDEGAEAVCYTIGEEDVTGQVELTSVDDGSVLTARRRVEGAAPAADAAAEEAPAAEEAAAM